VFFLKKIVSVSLGSSKRDHEVHVNLLGEEFIVSRRGTDGDYKTAKDILKELDGNVDVIGLGGTDIYLYSKTKRYTLKYGMMLRNVVKKTRVVDGSGLKNTLERKVIEELQQDSRFKFEGKKTLLVCGMDRFGMAESLVNAGCDMIFGDLIFALDVDKPLKTLEELDEQAEKLLPEISKLPIGMLYPIGKKQETYAELEEKHLKYYDWAEIIAGDFHYIRRFMPLDLKNKIIITNTVTKEDVATLKERGISYLVTTTPNLEGRSFGTNVLEGVLLSILDKEWEDVTEGDYLDLIMKLDLHPRILELNLV
jgi:hypothetical protein